MQDIIGLLFKYIGLLQQSGVCKWIFDEVCICNVLMYDLNYKGQFWFYILSIFGKDLW